jgi:hypothetical protein
VVGITRQKFMLRLCRPFTGMSQREQIMSTLYFLKKQDVRPHGRDCLLDAMDARSRAYGTDAFVNIPGRDAKFHAAWRFIGDCVIGRNIGLGVSDNAFENSAVPG